MRIENIGWTPLGWIVILSLATFFLATMMDILRNIWINWGGSHPFLSSLGVMFVAVVFWWSFGLIMWLSTPREQAGRSVEQPPSVTQPAGIRLKYSSRQTVQLSQQPGDYNETINLDNTAILALGDPADSESVTMLLQSDAPRTITKPKFGQKYRSGEETIILSPLDRGKTEMTDLTISAYSGQFHFDTSTNRVQVIRVANREFRISLDAINDKSTEGHLLIEYVFGISEQ